MEETIHLLYLCTSSLYVYMYNSQSIFLGTITKDSTLLMSLLFIIIQVLKTNMILQKNNENFNDTKYLNHVLKLNMQVFKKTSHERK